MSESAIQIDHLDHAFGAGELRRQVLFDVSTRIEAGEIVILTGPSGSGKTTLLTLIGALRSTQAGSLRVLGRELRSAPEEDLSRVRRRIGYVFQAHNLLDSLTAQQNVQMSLELDPELGPAEIEARALEALTEVGLGGRAGAHPSELSGGQRQRVAIARALARRPALVLADEPTASLDRQTGRTVVDLLQRLARRDGVTVVLVTHDNRILDVADRILTLEDGRLGSMLGAVTADTRQKMRLLARNVRRGELVSGVRDMDAQGFAALLDHLAEDTRRLLELIDLVQGEAFESVLEQVLGAFALKAADLLHVERATLFLVDEDSGELWALVEGEGGRRQEIRASLDRGIAGLVARTGATRRVAEVAGDAAFDASIDGAGRGAPRSLLAVPLRDARGQVFGVVELADREDGQPFEARDEARLQELTASLGLILESWWRMSCACRAAGFGKTCPCCGAPWHSHPARSADAPSQQRP
jgi:putative ABC transport system ATP-binding protein